MKRLQVIWVILGVVILAAAALLASKIGGWISALGGAQGEAAASPQPPTPTPEVFNPLDPSPTPSESDLPLTCQVTDLSVYIDRAAGYCFAYPTRFTLGEQPSDHPPVLGPALGSPVEPVQATFSVDVSPFDAGKTLQQQAEEFVQEFSLADPATYTWQEVTAEGLRGIVVEPVPARLSWRIVFAENGGSLYRLMYWPVDVPEAKTDLDELYQVTLNTFAFIPKTNP